MNRIAQILVAVTLTAAPALAHIEVRGLDINGQCVGDIDSNQQILINELITAVNNCLGGCPRLPITLKFSGVVGHEPFACGTQYAGIGTGSSQFIPADFRFYVSNIKLKPLGGDEVPLELEQDGIWQHENVALIDFETGPENGCNEGNSATNTEVKGTVPAGVYTSLSFDLGLPFDLNHGNASTAPSPLNFTAMFWSWNSGYKFIRIDTADDKFRVHIGSTGCDGGSPSRPPSTCSNENLARVTLTGFNPSHGVIEADIAALLGDSNIDMNDPDTPPGCMSDPNDADCEAVLRNLGVNVADGTPNPDTQKFFRLAAEHPQDEHVEFEVGSSVDGSGALVGHPEFDLNDEIPLSFAECLGGTGDECEGGTRLFTAVNPGVNSLEESEPDESLFTLSDGTQVSLELTAIDAGLVMRLGDTVLDGVGDSVVLGTIPPEFHADFETQLSLPGGGEPSGTFSASFKLTTTNAQYQSSEVVTIKFTPTEGEGGGHEDDD